MSRKMVDESEVRHWIEEGRTYRWMVEEYERKYNLQVAPTMFSNYRAKHGLARRITRDDSLIPWDVKPEHRHDHILNMLRVEARLRAGQPVPEVHARKHASFMARLTEGNLVVLYDPATEEGFFYVPRQASDTDIVRQPPKSQQTKRRPTD